MIELVFFCIFAAVTLGAALAVVLNRHPIYSVLSLLLAMFSLAAIFILLGAYFVAALQILLYAGAVLVLFLFVMMRLNLQPDTVARGRAFTLRVLGPFAALLLAVTLVRIVQSAPWAAGAAVPAGTVEAIGRRLFIDYHLPFELTSFLILAAIIGAVTLAKREPRR